MLEMTSFKYLVVATALLGLGCPAYGSDNFEFTVEGQVGLSLVITGYNRDGLQMFKQVVADSENRSEGITYVIRVDEAILQKSKLTEWCVEDPAGGWNLLPEGRPNVMLCDNKPFETRGSYKFESRTEKPGAIVRPIQPLVKSQDILKFGSGVTERQKNAISNGIGHARRLMKQKLGYSIAAPVKIFAAADAKWLTDNYLRERKLGNSFRKGKLQEFGCSQLSAEGGYRLMFLCMSSGAWRRTDIYGANVDVDSGNMFTVMHEHTHNMQYELLGERGRTCCADSNAMSVFGPQWLMEGAAEYLGFVLMAEFGHLDLDQHMLRMARQIGKEDLSLAKRETRKGFRERPNSWEIGPVAVHLLVSKAGYSSLPKFWEAIGKGVKMRKAFSVTFGRTPAEFEVEFLDYVMNPPASTTMQVD
jgi:hypothetical protein